jgi:hypothetical protein
VRGERGVFLVGAYSDFQELGGKLFLTKSRMSVTMRESSFVMVGI